MSEFWFKSVKVVDTQSSWNGKTVDIQISEGIIQSIRLSKNDSTQFDDDSGVHGKGGCISPGWLDMRVQLSDPGFEWKDDLISLSQSALKGGFTSLLCFPNTFPVIDNKDLILALKSREVALPVNLLIAGAFTKGCQGTELSDMFDMHQNGALAFTDGTHPIQEAGLIMRGLQYSSSFDGLIINYPIDLTVSGKTQVNESPQTIQLGMKGSPAIAESIQVNRDLELLNYSHGRMHLSPITTENAVKVLSQYAHQNKSSKLTFGTTLAHLCFTDHEIQGFDTHFKIFPPLRSISDRQALREMLVNKSSEIDTICSQHTPQNLEEKMLEFDQAGFGMLMLESFFGLANKELIETEVIALDKFIEKITSGPRKVLKMSEVKIEEGFPAELTHFETESSYTFQKQHLASKSSNSPLLGRELKGSVKGIFNKGAYQTG